MLHTLWSQPPRRGGPVNDPKNPEQGEQVIDASDVKLTDLTPQDIKEASKLRDGFEEVLTSLSVKLAADPASLERGGIHTSEVQRAIGIAANHARVAKLLPATRKLLELMSETLVANGHEIAGVI